MYKEMNLIIIKTCIAALFYVTMSSCYYQAYHQDLGREGLGGVNISQKQISEDSFILEVVLTPYLGESTASLVNRARNAADLYAKDECKKIKCKLAAQVSGHQGTEAFAARTWTFVYKCFDCSK
jgi:hypothetical protein